MKKIWNQWSIFIGLIVGCIVGLIFHNLKNKSGYESLVNFITNNIFSPMGDAFLYGLFMVIVPLVFSSLVLGVADMRNPSSIATLSKRLVMFYAFSTFIAILIGQFVMASLKPGTLIPREKVQEVALTMQEKMSSLKSKSSMVGSSLWPGLVTKIIPKNIIDQFAQQNILAVIFVSLIFGFSLLYLPQGPPRDSFIHLMSALSSTSIIIIKWIMKTAPFAVMAILASVVSELGWESIQSLLFYLLAMTLGLLTHLFGTYSLLIKYLIKIPVKEFFLRMLPIFTTAFSTSSSSATMPVTMDVLEKKFGVPKKISSFSIPIGATVNMDGTALFEVAAACFIAQVFGISLSLVDISLLIALVFITSVGIAGVPGGSIPVLMSSFIILGLPVEGIALIIGVDRLMDMARTTINVTGDSVATLYLTKKEGNDIATYIKNNP